MVLITGANGLVGSYLCRYLLQQGQKVRAIHRNNCNFKLIEDIKDQIEWVEGDILDLMSLEDAMKGIKKVYHCAAVISYLGKYADKMMRVNVEGTANIVNIALDNKIDKLIYISSIAALGRTGKPNEIVSEKTPWDRKNSTSDYSKSKFLAEREVWRAMAEGINAAIINPSIIVGAGNWDAGSCKLFSTIHNGFKFYTGGVTGYVDVRDVVKIAFSLMENNITNERFIVSAENLSYKEFLTTIAYELQVKGPTMMAGKSLSSLAWRAEWFKSKFSGMEPSVTRQTATIANKKVYFNNTKVVKELHYNFIPIKKSIADTASSFNKELKNGKFYPLIF